MKRFLVLLTLLSVLAILTACSSEPSLVLTDKKVDIVNDKAKTGSMTLQQGEDAGKEIVATSLYYTFHITNEGKKNVGAETKGKGLSVKIVPNENLIVISNEIMGFNLFDPSDYDELGMGHGYSYVGTIDPNETGEFIVSYDLGYEEESQEVRLAPSKEQLEKLKNNAFEATLLIMLGDEEIARYDLSETE